MLNLNGRVTHSLRLLQSLVLLPVSAELVRKALIKMKCGKAVGPSGIIAEMLKAAGEEGVELVRLLAETVFSSGLLVVIFPRTGRRASS